MKTISKLEYLELMAVVQNSNEASLFLLMEAEASANDCMIKTSLYFGLSAICLLTVSGIYENSFPCLVIYEEGLEVLIEKGQ